MEIKNLDHLAFGRDGKPRKWYGYTASSEKKDEVVAISFAEAVNRAVEQRRMIDALNRS
jgi:hypothetical protein